jgi:hypothetical protein
MAVLLNRLCGGARWVWLAMPHARRAPFRAAARLSCPAAGLLVRVIPAPEVQRP